MISYDILQNRHRPLKLRWKFALVMKMNGSIIPMADGWCVLEGMDDTV